MSVPNKAGPQTSRKQAAQFLLDEIIGKEVCVIKSNCKDLQGITGKILDETKNTLLLETTGGRKRVPKASCTLLFTKEGKGVAVNGALLCIRPEERTKKLFRKLH